MRDPGVGSSIVEKAYQANPHTPKQAIAAMVELIAWETLSSLNTPKSKPPMTDPTNTKAIIASVEMWMNPPFQ